VKGVSPPTRRAMVKTGTYTGDGENDRLIDIGIDLLSKNGSWVVVKALEASPEVQRIEYAQGDFTMHTTAAVDFAFGIRYFDTLGFGVGNTPEANADGYFYRWIAIWEEP